MSTRRDRSCGLREQSARETFGRHPSKNYASVLPYAFRQNEVLDDGITKYAVRNSSSIDRRAEREPLVAREPLHKCGTDTPVCPRRRSPESGQTRVSVPHRFAVTCAEVP